MALLYDAKNCKPKLKSNRIKPFRVVDVTPQGTTRLETMDRIEKSTYINGSQVQKYYSPLTKETLDDEREKRKALDAQKEIQRQAFMEAKDARKKII